jgi:hypothetical protein
LALLGEHMYLLVHALEHVGGQVGLSKGEIVAGVLRASRRRTERFSVSPSRSTCWRRA